jgi:hypothetical protein
MPAILFPVSVSEILYIRSPGIPSIMQSQAPRGTKPEEPNPNTLFFKDLPVYPFHKFFLE